jgi:hypothetical protein
VPPALSSQAGTVYFDSCKLIGNAGPHSFVLAIQFSKTEQTPSNRASRFEPCASRGHEDTVLRSGRRGFYIGRSVPSRGSFGKTRPPSRPEEPDFYTRPLRPVKLCSVAFASLLRHRGALLLTPRRVPRQASGSVPPSPSSSRGALCSPSEDSRQPLCFDFVSEPGCDVWAPC